MKKILGAPKSIRELFTGVKYSIHYYQREYQWQRKQVEELIEDLTGEFLEYYSETHERNEVEKYGHYFMGSVVLTEDENAIIDGQQRLTSLSLVLLFITKHLQDTNDRAEILNLIYSQKYGKTTFNINVEERTKCLEAIINDEVFEPEGHPESVQNIWHRYNDIIELMIDAIPEGALPFFKDWLIDNVQFIKIVAQTEQDAHKIFVSMNDRGLSLTATEMLKGYLLSEIAENEDRQKANELWKAKMLDLKALGKEQESDCIKTWLRSQYGETIRERKKNATPGDFDIIGTAFHKWLRENANTIGLKKSVDYSDLVQKEFILFSNTYIRISEYSTKLTEGFEYIFYNADRNFTLQPLLLLASLDKNDTKEIIDAKLRIVSCFLDQYISIRIFNFKTLDYSAMTYTMFMLAKKIRRKDSTQLVWILTEEIAIMEYNLGGIEQFHLSGWTKRYMLHQLARITHFVESQSGRDTKFDVYVNRNIKNPYDIEHIWVDHYERYSEEFESEEEFQRTRNMLGDLVLLPQDINRSLNDTTYAKKLPKYFGQNLLASSLNENCYENNPNFLRFAANYKLNFKPNTDFTKESIKERQKLYLDISKAIWNVENLKSYL
ncbi:DUF262 domain-containing protein [Aquirufa antheringensis]|uniref:DUF262 domain-containing protein n=1 Tax=Aquirufa antheringensis TaxID=2516559 RepID=UPI0010327DA3|nr:DUF262 domain-containing protein [Aquirufa antheringensis]TBH71454.1 DUF262 domain-containing protein [Aquirufa antheringensis]